MMEWEEMNLSSLVRKQNRSAIHPETPFLVPNFDWQSQFPPNQGPGDPAPNSLGPRIKQFAWSKIWGLAGYPKLSQFSLAPKELLNFFISLRQESALQGTCSRGWPHTWD
jgi:hypothetical protein